VPARASSPALPLDFEQVYTEHFDFIWRSVRGLGVPLAFVDDVAQDVFLVVHRKLESLESAGALKSWLFGIARRVCKDHRRAAIRRGPHVALDNERDVDLGRDPQQMASSRQALRAIERFAEGLDEERRALFFLAFIEGLPVMDVAATLDLNPNTAYSRVRAMRSELTAVLEDGGDSKRASHG
jgi:RNA polymerase sigma-70 factor (ECF subfamily)